MRVIYSLKWMVCSVLLFVVLFWMGATGAKAYDYAENMATGGVPSDEYCTNLELGSNNFLDFEKTGDVRRFKFTAPKAGRYLLWDNVARPKYDSEGSMISDPVMRVSCGRFIWHKTEPTKMKAIEMKHYNRYEYNINSSGYIIDVENAGDVFYLTVEAFGEEGVEFGRVSYTLQEQEWSVKPDLDEETNISQTDLTEFKLKPEIEIVEGKTPLFTCEWVKSISDDDPWENAGTGMELLVNPSDGYRYYRCWVVDKNTGQNIYQSFRVSHIFDDAIPKYVDPLTVDVPVEITGGNNGETLTYSFTPQETDIYSITGGKNVKFDVRVMEATPQDSQNDDVEYYGNMSFKMEAGKTYYIQIHRKKADFETFAVTISKKHEHTWSAPVYTWNSNYTQVTATRNCTTDSSHKETETVATTSEVTKKATYTAKGQTTYTAQFKNTAFTTQRIILTNINKLEKKANPIKTSAKKITIKYNKKFKKKNKIIAAKAAFNVTNAQGTVTYKLKKVPPKAKKKILVTKNGKVTIKKKLAKGNYQIIVEIKAAGNTTYKAVTKTVKMTIVIK